MHGVLQLMVKNNSSFWTYSTICTLYMFIFHYISIFQKHRPLCVHNQSIIHIPLYVHIPLYIFHYTYFIILYIHTYSPVVLLVELQYSCKEPFDFTSTNLLALCIFFLQLYEKLNIFANSFWTTKALCQFSLQNKHPYIPINVRRFRRKCIVNTYKCLFETRVLALEQVESF